MNILYLFALTPLVISVVLAMITIPRIVIIAKLKRLYDPVNDRKVHQDPTPRLGGLSFFPTMMIAFCLSMGAWYYAGLDTLGNPNCALQNEVYFFTAGICLLFFIGLADDLVGIGYRVKFVVQIAVALLISASGIYVTELDGLLGIYTISAWISIPLTAIFIVFVVNAFNLIDGVDGLCSCISTVILSVIGGWFMVSGMITYAMIAFAMVGVVAVFFYYNVSGRRMKIFMGDTGSLTLGLLIAFLGLKFINIEHLDPTNIINSPTSLFVGLIFIPIFDTLRVFVTRLYRGHSPFVADKNHIHHKMLALGFTHIKSTEIIILMQIGFFVLNLVLSQFLNVNINAVIALDLLIGVVGALYINRSIHLKNND